MGKSYIFVLKPPAIFDTVQDSQIFRAQPRLYSQITLYWNEVGNSKFAEGSECGASPPHSSARVSFILARARAQLRVHLISSPHHLLFHVVFTLYLAWCFFRTIGISHIPRCYGNLVTMATTVSSKYLFCLKSY